MPSTYEVSLETAEHGRSSTNSDKKGVQDFRIDLLDELKETVRHLLGRYTFTPANPETGRSLIREEGWSEGQLRRNERSIKHR